eukprot:323274-Pelagomonas_calceolata.AAC.1
MPPIKLRAIWLVAALILPSRLSRTPSYLDSVTTSRAVPLYSKVGSCEESALKKPRTRSDKT